MKGFAYLDQTTSIMVHVDLKYPDDMPDQPTLDDVAEYCAKHRFEESTIISNNVHTRMFKQLIQDKREKYMKKIWAKDDTA